MLDQQSIFADNFFISIYFIKTINDTYQSLIQNSQKTFDISTSVLKDNSFIRHQFP